MNIKKWKLERTKTNRKTQKKEEKEADGKYFIWPWLKIFEWSINIRGLLHAAIIRYP